MPEDQQNQGPFSDPNRPAPPAGVPQGTTQETGSADQPAEPTPAQPEQPARPPSDVPSRQAGDMRFAKQVPDGARPSLFGPNGRYLWFAGGVLFALIGVLFAVLFNWNRPASVRYDAIKYAVWGTIAGIAIEVVLVTFMGGPEGFLSLFGFQDTTAASGGSVF